VSFWDSLVDRLQTLGEHVVEWGILIIVALVVLVIGRWLIGLIRTWTEKLLASRPMQPIWDRSGVSAALQGTEQTPASIGATILYAYLMVALLLVVVRILRIGTIETLLERLLAWIPLLLLAAIIVIVSAAAGNWAANLVRPFADEQGVPWLGKVVHIGIIVFGTLFALELMNIEFAEDIVKIVIGAGAVAAAIAFGVGGIDAGKKWWAKYGSPKGGPGAPPPSPPTV
jgi:Mechanosensitive ion channel, conserved TM helix